MPPSAHRLRRAASYLARRATGVPHPSGLFVETTVRCNLRCPMCVRTREAPPSADMPDERVERLLREHAALGGDHVYLFGLGEPLLDRRMPRFLRLARSLGLGTILSSNGTLLADPTIREQLLEEPPDHLMISVDAADPAAYAHYRAGGRYDETVEGVRRLAEAKARRGGRWVLSINFIRMPGNREQVARFSATWRGAPGVDIVRVKNEDMGLDGYSWFAPDADLRRNPCHLLWGGPLAVRHSGEVYACTHIAACGEPLGHVDEQGLAALWNGPAMARLRAAHRSDRGRGLGPCSTCVLARPRLPFAVGAMLAPGLAVRRALPLLERLSDRHPGLFSEPRRLNVARPAPQPASR